MDTKISLAHQTTIVDEKITEVKAAIDGFIRYEDQIEKWVQQICSISSIKSAEKRDEAHGILSNAQKAIGSYQDLRMKITRPIDDLKKHILAYEKETVSDLQKEMKRVTGEIREWDDRIEALRQQELKRLEEERQKRVRERVEYFRKMTNLETSISTHIQEMYGLLQDADSKEVLIQIRRNALKWYMDMEFGIPSDQFTYPVNLKEKTDRLFTAFMDAVTKRDAFLMEERNRKILAATQQVPDPEAEAEAERVAQDLRKQEEEARIEREKIVAQEEADRLEREAIAKLEEAEREKANERIRKELEDARAKGLTSEIETIEVLDITKVPKDLYEVKWKMRDLKAALKKGDVPGIQVTFKNKLILNG